MTNSRADRDPLLPGVLTAKDRAYLRWNPAQVERQAAVPHPCRFCGRAYGTERGATQHGRNCWKNPQAKRYVSGEYRPIYNAAGRIMGMVSNGANEVEGARIRRSMEACFGSLGVPAPIYKPSGSDEQERPA